MKRIFELTGTCNIPSRASRDLPPLSIPKERAPKMPEKPWPLLDCPVEIQLSILGLLSKKDLVSMSLVNKHLAQVAQLILHRESDLSCPPTRLEGHPTPLLLFVRTLLNRPNLAQAVQHLHFDGYDFPRRIVDEYPATSIASLPREDKLKALTMIHGSLLSEAVGWSKCFLVGRIDSIVALLLVLTHLKYAFAWHRKSRNSSNLTQSLDLGALRESLEGHRLGLEKLELLTVDTTVLIKCGTHWAFTTQGPPLKLHDFSNLRLLTVPWIFIAGNSKGAHPTPLRYIIPESVIQLSLTDDLHLERCWGWASKDIQNMVTDYLHDVHETKTALRTIHLVGPFNTKILTDEQLFFTRLFARSAGIDFRAVEMTIPEKDELREKN